MVDDRSAALLVRVWLEGDDAFRARLTALSDSVAGSLVEEMTVALVSSPGDVLIAVRAWLDEFLGNQQTDW